jgi:UMF1 family MFS transporter
MTDASIPNPAVSSTAAIPRGRVAAWALWDAGSAGINAITTTFVFNRYLVSGDFADPATVAAHGKAAALVTLQSQFGLASTLAGLVVLLIAPVLGQQSDARGRRKLWLGVNTALVVATLIALFFVQGKPSFLLMGLVLFGVGTIFYEIAAVSYNAMLAQVSTPKNVGRISGLGWSFGYLGGIVLLLLVYVGLVSGSDPDFGGVLHVPTADGLNIRVVELVAAVWTLGFSLPVFFAVPELPKRPAVKAVSFFRSYVVLGRDIARLWKSDRNTVMFLIASAVFRDGLTGIFQFGAILAGTVFGFSAGEVLIFGIAANVVAGVSTLLVGLLDDRLGPRRVILISLIGLVVAGLAVFFLHDGGQSVFWVGGLILCLFVGPAQSASRSFLTRVTPQDKQGEVFGLYATTGRAAIFIAPALFTLFTVAFGAAYWGTLGIVVVVLAGLILFLFVKPPTQIRFAQPVDAETAVESQRR